MSWTVRLSKRVVKATKKLPPNVLRAFEALIDDLEVIGPMRGDWPNYSKLSDGSHHCHLSYSYVAVWRVTDKEIRLMEVIYVGSRENAPY